MKPILLLEVYKIDRKCMILKDLQLPIFQYYSTSAFLSLLSILSIVYRDIVADLKLEGPNYNGALSPPKNGGGPKYTFT